MNNPVAFAWANGGEYSEQLDWATDVLQAATGPTQHRRMRQSPRSTVSFSMLESGARRRRMEEVLRTHAAGRWYVPIAVDGRVLTAAVIATDTVLPLEPGDARFVAGGHALVWGDSPESSRVVSIDAAGVGASSLALAAPVGADFPAGACVVPVRVARLSEIPALTRFTSCAIDVTPLKWRLEESLDDAPVIAGTPYRGFPVFSVMPDWSSEPQWAPERAVQTVDYGIAAPLVADIVGMAQSRTVVSYTLANRADILAFRQMLYALAGRWSPCWVPSWAEDFRVVANVADGATHIDVEGPQLAGLDLVPNHRDIRIALHNGTVLYRRIGSVSVPSAGVERLTLDSAIATGFSASDVALVSWMALCTQDSDTNLLRYWTHEVMECELTWRELVHAL